MPTAHKDNIFSFISVVALVVIHCSSVICLAIYRKPLVRIIGIIPSLPVFNYRLELRMKSAAWPWSQGESFSARWVISV